MRTGRKRKPNVRRDARGKSRGVSDAIDPETLAIRARELRAAGFEPRFAGQHASDALAGFTLGVLHLRWQADRNDPGGISPEQFNAAQAWTRLVHRHAAIMGYSLNIRTPSFIMVGSGITCLAEPEEKEILSVRRQWSDCYNALMAAARDHGLRVSIVTYGVCVENWPVGTLSGADLGLLRIGLNALGKVV
jgi:hypothetical protein